MTIVHFADVLPVIFHFSYFFNDYLSYSFGLVLSSQGYGIEQSLQTLHFLGLCLFLFAPLSLSYYPLSSLSKTGVVKAVISDKKL